MKSKLRYISFDAAGTLFTVRGSVGEQYAFVARRHGLDPDPVLLESNFRATFRAAPPLCFPDLVGNHKKLKEAEKTWWREIVAAVFHNAIPDPQLFADFFNDLYEYFGQKEAWSVFDDVVPTLTRLVKDGFSLGVLSNFDSRLHTLLKALQLAPFFSEVVCSSEIGFAKPDPQFFVRGLPAQYSPAEVVHIGDQLDLDARPAELLGMKALLIDRKSAQKAPPSAIFPVLKSLSEIFQHL